MAQLVTLFGYPYKEKESCCFAFARGSLTPNLVFSIPKSQMFIDPDFTVNPIAYIKDTEITDAMHIDFGGDPSFIFGTYRPTRNHRFFDVVDPLEAEHLLIKVEWGDLDLPKTHGYSTNKARQIKYVVDFAHSGNKRLTMGKDYWIVPVGFYVGKSASPCKFRTRGQKYCQYYSDLRRENLDHARAAAAQRTIDEQASRLCRDSLLKRLEFLRDRLLELQRYTNRHLETIDLKDKTYYKVGYKSFLYSKENVDATEKWFCGVEDQVLEDLARK